MRDLRWIAQSVDGRVIKEYDFTGSWAHGSWTENWFATIDLSKVISFGIEGSNLRVGFRSDDGIIGINGRALELALEDREGYIFPITGRKDVFYRVVQYKEAHFSIGSGAGRFRSDSGIDAYCVGWSTSGKDDRLGNWDSKLVVRVPSLEIEPLEANLEFRCDLGFIGVLRIRFGGCERPRVDTILRPGTLNRIAMHVWW